MKIIEKNKILKYAILNSVGTAVYIILIVSFIYLGSKGIFGSSETIFIPIFMLMLFVFSAVFTGALVLGRPVMWYLDGKKREALSLFIYTLLVFLIFTITSFFILILLT